MYTFLHNHRWYIFFFVIGALSAVGYSPAAIHAALEASNGLSQPALIGSLLLAFAAFGQNERKNKWWFQNAPLGIFGAYAVEVMYAPSLIKVVLLILTMGMHLSYWDCSIHSRNYRYKQFLHGFSQRMPYATELTASLNGTGRAELADQLVSSILAYRQPTNDFWTLLPPYIPSTLRDQVRQELDHPALSSS